MKRMSQVHKRTVAILFGFLLIAFSEQAFAQGAWETKAPMPTGVVFAAGGVINGKLFVVSGSPPPANLLQVYDPGANSWTTMAAPVTRCAAASGVISGKLYVAGGGINCDNNATTNILQVYDPVTDSWETKAPMPTARNHMAAGVVGGKLYAIGGMQACAPCVSMKTVEVYDPVTNTWASGAPMPTPRWGHGAAVIDGKIYVVGGNNVDFPGDPSTFLGTLEVYDPATNTWDTTKAPMPTARHLFGAGVINGQLHAVGGLDCCVIFTTHEVYNPTTDTWTTDTSMPAPRYGFVAEVINSQLYAAGGANSTGILNTLEVFTPQPPNQRPIANAGPDQTVDATSPAGALVILNGTGSSDPDGDSLTFSWIGPFGTAVGATPTVLLPVGMHIISLTVTDPSGATSTDTVAVTVLSPSQMTSNLTATVTSLNFQQGINLLQAALKHINAGNNTPACNQLSAFINQVQAQSGRQLTVNQANQLIASANQIKAALGCP